MTTFEIQISNCPIYGGLDHDHKNCKTNQRIIDIITKNFVWDMIIFFRYPALFLFTVATATQKKNALSNEKISILLHKKFFVIMSNSS